MEYLDFELRIGKLAEGVYPLVVVDSPAGQPQGSVPPSFVPAVLREALRLAGRTRGRRTLDPNEAPAPEPAEGVARQLGVELFEALLSDDLYACYQTSLQRARDQQRGLRLRLRIDAPELAVLPWEFLFDPKLKRDHLCLSRETPVVRHLEVSLGIEPLGLEPPIHMLGMIGAGDGLDVERERRDLMRAVEHLTDRGALSVDWVDGHDWRSLKRHLAGARYHVFHFIGHGGFDETTGEGVIELGAGQGTERRRLRAGDLAGLLADHRTLKLVVLNSCEGARASETDLFSSTGAVLAARGIPAVVSMQFPITDDAALEFSRAFYDDLAEGRPVDAALGSARTSIRLALEDTWEWATPVLHMRAEDGHLFRVDLAGALFRGGPARAVEEPVREPAPGRGQSGPRDPLAILRRKVRAYWIDGVLTNALARTARLRLGVQAMAGAVDNWWSGTLETREGSTRLESPEVLGALLEEFGSSLLVLGEPGSGKTVSLLELAAAWLDRADVDPGWPVPVVFNLSSWATDAAEIGAWLERELSVKYQIPKHAGRAWLAGGRILPLMDGLDEVAEASRAACVGAINACLGESSSAGAVICCRLKEYLALPVKLALNGAIRMQPLRRQDVLEALETADDRLAGLRALLQRDTALLQEARTPLMLSLMAQAFDGVPAAEITSARDADLAQRRRWIMQTFVERAFRRTRAGVLVG